MKQKKDKEFWENKFETEGVNWGFEPCDSATSALELFTKYNLRKILIPGFGFGRNAKLFLENGFDVTGIEISKAAIRLAKMNGINSNIHHGSVLNMPFDDEKYEGTFSYALLHLFNKNERRIFLKSCFKQLTSGGFMIFVVISEKSGMFGQGKKLSNNRYMVDKGLNVYFYNPASAFNEFKTFGLVEIKEVDEPIKHLQGFEPLKCIYVVCRKTR